MKKILLCLIVTIATITTKAQEKPVLSPPATAKETLSNGTIVTINYAQPSVKGRKIGEEIAPFGKVWRTGANAATQFEVSKDVMINGKILKAGKYALFTIPGPKEWTFIFNKVWDQWGAYKYEESQDVLRVAAKSAKAKSSTEKMTFEIAKSGQVNLLWGDVQTGFKIK